MQQQHHHTINSKSSYAWIHRSILIILVVSLTIAVLRSISRRSFDKRISRRENVQPKSKVWRFGRTSAQLRQQINTYTASIRNVLPSSLSHVQNSDNNSTTTITNMEILQMELMTYVRRKLASWLKCRVYCWHIEPTCTDISNLHALSSRYRSFPTTWVFIASHNSPAESSTITTSKYDCALLPVTELSIVLEREYLAIINNQKNNSNNKRATTPTMGYMTQNMIWPVICFVFSSTPAFLHGTTNASI